MPRALSVPTARAFLPEVTDLPHLAEAAAACEGCHLYERATQTVFGEGDAGAPIMLVGEQPGDQEDTEGAPFVGPAGRLLDRALGEAGIERGRVYVTNAVKHFKWEGRGKRRIHKRPSAEEVAACKPWLEAEIDAVGPRVVVCLGATAARALLGPRFRVTQMRGQFVDWPLEPLVTATVHPSSILRVEEPEDREVQFAALVADLRRAADAVSP